MHSNSSRPARCFTHPTMVFNLHEQFEKLREEHVFERMRTKIRQEDIKYSGSINPMVSDFGTLTEAIQYSGRQVSSKHKCPFLSYKEKPITRKTIAPRTGVAFKLEKGAILIVEDVMGEQVADLFCFYASNHEGRSIDYASKIYFSQGDILYSNLSNKMLTIISDDVGCHDFLFTPCSKDTFRIIYDEINPGKGCYEHLIEAFKPYDIVPSKIGTTFNIFMNVTLSLPTGKLNIMPPKSKRGDKKWFQSHMDLIIGLTACSAKQSNNHSFKPINYQILSEREL